MRTEPTAQTEWCASSPLPPRTGAATGRFALAGALAAMLLGITAAQAQSAPDIYKATLGQQNQATAEISTEELRRILDEKSATVFDARPFMEYGAGHIAGAVNVARLGCAMPRSAPGSSSARRK
jgi:Rhodanese-like domain